MLGTMQRRPARRKRPAVKESRILEHMRQQIVRGDLTPGMQLPKRTELEREYNVSPLTLQRALQQLIDDGFLYAKTGQGTFVAANPPHLSRYGLLFPFHPSDRAQWISYYVAINNEAEAYQREHPNKLRIYYGLEQMDRIDEREKLFSDVESHRLAGLIFASRPHNFQGTPLLDEPQVARVAVMADPGFGIPSISLEGSSFVTKALDHLAARGRRHVALINNSTMGQNWFDLVRREMAKRDMVTFPYWIHGVHLLAADWTRNLVQLIFQGPKELRPDALFISDDNLVPQATAGLLAAGINVPDECDVVAHANFPWPTQTLVPARRLGYDAREVLNLCLNSIDRQRQGEQVPPATSVRAVFEEELKARQISVTAE
jgi:DNA-binding LacI/PurR family transcriptional regulator